MTCNLKQTCTIPDISKVRKFLFASRETDIADEESGAGNDWDADSWINTWGEDDVEGNEGENESSENVSHSWMHDCHIAFSPTYDLLALGYEDKLVLLTAKSNTSSSMSRVSSSRKYQVSSELQVSDEATETITSLLCVPLVSLKQTSHGSVDWSCVIVGFNTGYVKLYTENGALLISQLFHESPVVELKCRTHDARAAKARSITGDQTDEVTVLYDDALVVFDGFSLFQTLRACRSQVALAAASGGMTIEPPPMSYKKWRLIGGQSPVASHISPGVLTPDPFEQMRTASILGGYAADIRGTAPAMSCFVATGSSPFIGHYYAVEGSTQPHLSHVALAVASKLKSALYSSASRWLSWGTGAQQETTASQKPKPKIELGSPLDIRCGMPDPLRHGGNVILAPGASLSSTALAATTDNLGRVILMDVVRGIALRMWKGYREAQVGFIRVFDDAHKSHHKHHRHPDSGAHEGPDMKHTCKSALFLLIYAPRRGLLEIWTCINGPRVGAFNVSKNARLICPGHGMMGLSASTVQGTTARAFQCCLLEANGQVREIRVPFHLALSDANSKKARDMHLLKKLNLLLHSRRKTGEEAVKILLEIRISGMLRQALEKLLHTRKLGAETFRQCIAVIKERLSEGGVLKKEDSDLLRYCNAQKELIDMYEALQKLNDTGLSHQESVVTEIEDVSNVDQMCKLLHMTRTEAEEALSAVRQFQESLAAPRVRFDSGENLRPLLDVAEFLDCFSFHNDITTSESLLESRSDHIQLNMTDPAKTVKLATFLFHASLYGSTAPDDVLFTVNSCLKVAPRTVLTLLFQHWCQQDTAITDNLANSLSSLYMFVESNNRKIAEAALSDEDHSSEFDQKSPDAHSDLWEWLREDICVPANNTIAAYFLAVVARAVAIASNSQRNKEDKEELEGDWESMDAQEAEEAVEEEPPPSYQDSCTGEKMKPKEASSGDWETLWIDTEKWNLLVHQLEDCLLINTAVNLGKKKPTTAQQKRDDAAGGPERRRESLEKVIDPTTEEKMDNISVKDLLSNGPGYMAELISHAICRLDVAPDMIRRDGDRPTCFESSLENQAAFLDFLHKVLFYKFPYSLASDCLHSHCFWELMAEWNKEPIETEKLLSAIEHLRLVKTDPHARHGLAVMAWKTFLHKRYLSLAKLIDKVGKAPKDRLCRKDIGISDVLMASFCQACTDILQTIADADLDLVPKPSEDDVTDMSGGTEDAWQAITGKRSIMDMGRAHSHAHYGLVQHNMHLCFILHATMQFALRGVKPLSSLFDRRGISCFTLDMTTRDPILPNPDSIDLSINKARHQFLSKVVTAAVQRLADQLVHRSEDVGVGKGDLTEQQGKDELEKWIETSVHMASEFQIDAEKVKMHHVIELFKNGLDTIGSEAVAAISDKEVLSSSLVLIVGQRLSHILLHARPDDGVIMMSRMPPMLSTWIRSQDSSLLKKPDVPIADTLSLARTVLTMMSEHHSQYSIALFLEEAASAIASP